MTGNNVALGKRGGFRARWRDYAAQCSVFFRGFLEHPRMVGSIIPSSRFTVRQMLAPVDWGKCEVFVEYGPGIGTFCRPVLDKLRGDGALVVIDTNPIYIDYLNRSIRDKRFHAVLGSAENVEQILRDLGLGQADYVLSGLPFSTLPAGVASAIAKATHDVLKPGGGFLAYQFTSAVRDESAPYFERIDAGFEWLNILPCKLYWAWKAPERG
ncbi:class I SAM-dependent methyltransferase [Erythrobacter rubeus]|uniref:Methyltransferase domain-containing protein n=1 Tax=Erythrobacter rubeus TaxID=2760803 RepID=A0ABR8KPU8_9SPHN|nr:methyltransferase domain-containing protein [Erythrobacter rubeus]MBD2842768.1 methyltransferase domain-containing protein [Erythrobacter rubeus]